MKRKRFFRALSWIVLIALAAGLYGYVYVHAARTETTISAPSVQIVRGEDGKLILQWKAVSYATSYRLYRLNEGSGWELLGAVGAGVHSYELPADSPVGSVYAVRACHTSKIGTALSKYSRAMVGG